MDGEIRRFYEMFRLSQSKKEKEDITDQIISNLKIKNTRTNRKKINRKLSFSDTTLKDSYSQTEPSISNHPQDGIVHQIPSKTFATACLSTGLGFKVGKDFLTILGVKTTVLYTHTAGPPCLRHFRLISKRNDIRNVNVTSYICVTHNIQ